MSQKIDTLIAVIGIDIGKNSFHVVGLDQHGAFHHTRTMGAIRRAMISNTNLVGIDSPASMQTLTR
jgi:Tfp pilus assembly PilM family ATPase